MSSVTFSSFSPSLFDFSPFLFLAFLVLTSYTRRSAMNLTLGSVSGFLPTIVKVSSPSSPSSQRRELTFSFFQGLGYTAADAQIYTVPPYAAALGVMLLMTTISDRYQTRGIPAMIVFGIGIVGWFVLLSLFLLHTSTAHLHVSSAPMWTSALTCVHFLGPFFSASTPLASPQPVFVLVTSPAAASRQRGTRTSRSPKLFPYPFSPFPSFPSPPLLSNLAPLLC